MTEVWLNFTDPTGTRRRMLVNADNFVIGRHSASSLAIPDSRLSREHAKIARFGDFYVVTDSGSSNGTKVNGSRLGEPVTLKDGDLLDLGGLEVVVEFVSDKPAASGASANGAANTAPAVQVTASQTSAGKPKAAVKNSPSGSIPIWVILAAPIAAVVLVVLAGGVIFIVATRGSTDISANQTDMDEPSGISIDSDTPTKDKDDGPSGSNSGPATVSTPAPGQVTNDTPPESGSATPTPANLPDTAKVEIHGAAFLRKVAQNDPRIFLTGEQAQKVNAKIKQVGGGAVADNIRSANKNAAQIRALAAAKNMKPQFLAAAAIAKLGSSRGDVLQTAQSMAEVLDKLTIQLGNELADDCLLTIAAYDQGAAGETMKLRNMLQDLATKSTESSRTIRTIWFLQKQGKITAGEYDRAITFLAVGTIAQNPKDFGVSAEALSV